MKTREQTQRDERACPKCGSNKIHDGHGLAAGGIGSYTICLDCCEILSYVPDREREE